MMKTQTRQVKSSLRVVVRMKPTSQESSLHSRRSTMTTMRYPVTKISSNRNWKSSGLIYTVYVCVGTIADASRVAVNDTEAPIRVLIIRAKTTTTITTTSLGPFPIQVAKPWRNSRLASSNALLNSTRVWWNAIRFCFLRALPKSSNTRSASKPVERLYVLSILLYSSATYM